MSIPYAIVDEQGAISYEDASKLSAPSYEYNKLLTETPQFRLLQLVPGENTRLECEISTHVLDSPEAPAHTALSYTWDNPKHDNLVVNGQRISEKDELRTKYKIRHPLWCGSNRLLISTGLRDALLKIRDKNDATTLWVDAICINQDDLAERASQVLLMQRIFHTASTVFMWLGTEDECARQAFLLLPKLASLDSQSLSEEDIYWVDAMESFGLPRFPSAQWKSFIDFFARAYFRRIWIVQELMAAPVGAQVYCGDLQPIGWTDVISAVILLDQSGCLRVMDSQYGGENNVSFVSVALFLGLEWMEGVSSPAERLRLRQETVKTRRFEASDPRDKVFALIGIINDFGHRDLFGEDAPEGHGPKQVWLRTVQFTWLSKSTNRGNQKKIELLLRFRVALRKLLKLFT